jgi:hydrogenase-4 component E
MNLSQIDLFAAGAAVLAVWMCGVTRVKTQLWGLVLQTAMLSGICVLLSVAEAQNQLLILALVVFLIKAVGIPVFLERSAKRMAIERDNGAGISPTLALMVGCGLLFLGYFLTPKFAVPAMMNQASEGMALALILISMLLMITRRLAISQVIGFLTMENGIFLYSLTQTRHMPMLVEMWIVFEALIGALIAGVFIFRINRSFEHIDVTDMRRLRH